MGIQFGIDDIFADGSARRTDLAKARIFCAIHNAPEEKHPTRRTLTKELKLRPATISAMVGELIADGLIAESHKIPSGGKGRPEISLKFLPQRILVVAIEIQSQTIRGVLTDLDGQAVAESSVTVTEKNADREDIVNAFESIVDELLSRRPANTVIPGIGIALPGIVDPHGLRWISAARWPRISGLNFNWLAERTGLDVHIERKRQAELRARLQRHPQEQDQSVLYVVWGYGISSAFSQNGVVLSSAIGGFGDLGHWLVDPESRQQCLCGQMGCLEAHAALWALQPEIRAAFPDIPNHPGAVEYFVRSHDISTVPGLERATHLFALSLHNMFKAFFPDKIVLSGHFPHNPGIAERVRAFFARMPEYSDGRVTLEIEDSNANDSVIGMATPLFNRSLQPFLTAKDARI
ncbi:MAG: ROK family protein [Rhodospirillales bacterium]|nr:ROK family protein [Alphaproteobacteria bacterium]MBL6928530.1 ROK family protein [Rhodospirillales bacterium]